MCVICKSERGRYICERRAYPKKRKVWKKKKQTFRREKRDREGEGKMYVPKMNERFLFTLPNLFKGSTVKDRLKY